MKLSNTLTLVAGAVVASAYTTEVVNGFTFHKTGPKDMKPIAEYVAQFNKTALEVLGAPADADLIALKESLTEDEMLDRLAPEIASANDFWHEVVDNSTDDWVSTDAIVGCFLPNLTAIQFALWSISPLADEANLGANAEHYIKDTESVLPLVYKSHIVEGWGGVTTEFNIPDYTLPNHIKYPMLRLLPGYLLQSAGGKELLDGTLFGVLHISVRDIHDADEGHGVEVYSTVWYPDGAPEDALEVESEHMVVEIINLTQQAQKDIAEGKLTLTGENTDEDEMVVML